MAEDSNTSANADYDKKGSGGKSKVLGIGIILVLIGGVLTAFFTFKNHTDSSLSTGVSTMTAPPTVERKANKPEVVEAPAPFVENTHSEATSKPEEATAKVEQIAKPNQAEPFAVTETQRLTEQQLAEQEAKKAAELQRLAEQQAQEQAQKAAEAQRLAEQQAEQEKANLAQIAKLLPQCQKHLKADRLTTGKGGTALVCYQQVLAIDSDNAEALNGLISIDQRYEKLAKRALNRRQFRRVKRYLAKMEKVNPQSTALAKLKQRLEEAER